jgi:hypothetical protein
MNYKQILEKAGCDTIGFGWDPKFCTSNKLRDDAAISQAILWVTRTQVTVVFRLIFTPQSFPIVHLSYRHSRSFHLPSATSLGGESYFLIQYSALQQGTCSVLLYVMEITEADPGLNCMSQVLARGHMVDSKFMSVWLQSCQDQGMPFSKIVLLKLLSVIPKAASYLRPLWSHNPGNVELLPLLEFHQHAAK